MRRYAAILYLCLLLCPRAWPQSEEAQFRPLLDSFRSTWNKHNAHAFAEIFSEDAVITTAGGTRLEGREAIEKYLQPSFVGPGFKDSTYSAEIALVRLIAPAIAILDLDWELTGARARDGTTRGPRKGTFNWVVVRKDGRWEIASFHNSEFPQAPQPQ